MNPWIIVDGFRCDFVDQDGVRQWKLSISRWRLLWIFISIMKLVSVRDVYIPHHRLNRRSKILTVRARRIHYIDDGLDTRRQIPKNIGLDLIEPNASYFTFKEYDCFPLWMQKLSILQVESLRNLVFQKPFHGLELSSYTHIFIESPGLEINDLVKVLSIDPAYVLVFRHPSPPKRKDLGFRYRMVEGRDFGVDDFIRRVQGKSIYFGETMSFFVALANQVQVHNKMYLSMPRREMHCLHGLPVMEDCNLTDGAPLYRVVKP